MDILNIKQLKNLIKLINNYFEQIIPAIPKGLSATVYTQLSDVEDEVNGLITYDRKVIKVDVEKIKYLNSLIKYLD